MTTQFLHNAWYAAAWSDEVKQALFERTLIGKSVLFYRAPDGQALAFDNACPHRSAPLSMGRLHGDVVECAYHDLRFDRSGMCIHNPHGNQKIPVRACAHPSLSAGGPSRLAVDLDGRRTVCRRR